MTSRADIEKRFWALCPIAPLDDAEAILSRLQTRKKGNLPTAISLWLTVVAHIRHRHTDYDALLQEGYEQDAARHFTLEATNGVLKRWGCTREIEGEDDASV